MRRAERSGGTEVERGLEAMGKELVRREVLHALVYEKADDRVVEGIRNSGMTEGEKGVKTAASRRGSHETPEDMCVVGRIGSRKNSSPSLKRTRSDNVGVEAFVDWKRESSGGI